MKIFKSKALNDKLWICDRFCYIPAFEMAIESLKEMSAGEYQYMNNVEPKQWSWSHI